MVGKPAQIYKAVVLMIVIGISAVFILQFGPQAQGCSPGPGVATVADFRQADIAAGGQGAPLVPWTDFVLLRSPTRARAV